MVLYTGGTRFEPELSRYSFFGNFFSDLGRTTTFSGASNAPVYYIFTLTGVLAGAATIVFFLLFPKLFPAEKKNFWLWSGSLLGVASGICYIGISLTPWDIYFNAHILFVKVGFSFFLAACIVLSIWIHNHPDYPLFYSVVFGMFIVILSIYMVILFTSPGGKLTPAGIRIQVVSQKIVLYAQMICMTIQCFGAYRVAKLKN